MSYNIVIVGCGSIAGINDLSAKRNYCTHNGAIRSIKNLNIAGCVDKDPLKAGKFSEIADCTTFTDIEQALQCTNPDVVAVCTPDDTHVEIAKTILNQRNTPKVLFMEKPLCKTLSEYNQLKKAASKTSTLVVTNHSRRFDQRMNEIYEMIKNESLGRVKKVRATYYSGWLHNGTHLVDTLCYLFGDIIEWTEVLSYSKSPYEGDDTLEVRGKFKNSDNAIHVDYIDENYYQVFEFDIFLSEGRIRILDFGNEIVFERKIVNKIGENVLEKFERNILNEYTPMQMAYMSIERYLKEGSQLDLAHVTLEGILPTLQQIWLVKELHLGNLC